MIGSKKTSSESKKAYDKERKKLAKKAWEVFSRYTRRRLVGFNDLAPCYTCGRKFIWKEMDAGHFRHTKRKKGGVRSKEVDYDERNINPQCTYCNRMLHGNLARYAQRLVQDHGPNILDELHKVYQEGKELTNEELKQIISKYGNK